MVSSSFSAKLCFNSNYKQMLEQSRKGWCRQTGEYTDLFDRCAGGRYAEKVVVPAGQILPVPHGVSLKDAASFPEVACTVWSTVFMMSKLSSGETFLVHGGSSGIGIFAI